MRAVCAVCAAYRCGTRVRCVRCAWYVHTFCASDAVCFLMGGVSIIWDNAECGMIPVDVGNTWTDFYRVRL